LFWDAGSRFRDQEFLKRGGSLHAVLMLHPQNLLSHQRFSHAPRFFA
jgi:hypothetical protein